MTDKDQASAWPMPKFHFSVRIGDQEPVPFQEVTGLDIEAEVIEYRAGRSTTLSTIKMPGIVKTGNVTLKRGIYPNSGEFWDWFKQIKMNTITRQQTTISLLDQEGSPTMVWTLANAWPVKITGTNLNSEGNEIVVESLEFAHEGINTQNG